MLSYSLPLDSLVVYRNQIVYNVNASSIFIYTGATLGRGFAVEI